LATHSTVLRNANRGHRGWARLNALVVEQIEALATFPAHITVRLADAIVAVFVGALALQVFCHTRLDFATTAVDL